jgi:hypothetical protein
MPDERASAGLPAAEAAAFDDLAPLYRWALALDARGKGHDEIAADLAVPVESVPALLRLAYAKSAAAAAREIDGAHELVEGVEPEARLTPPT